MRKRTSETQKPKTHPLKTEESATNSKPLHVLAAKHAAVIPVRYGHLANCDVGGKTVAGITEIHKLASSLAYALTLQLRVNR